MANKLFYLDKAILPLFLHSTLYQVQKKPLVLAPINCILLMEYFKIKPLA